MRFMKKIGMIGLVFTSSLSPANAQKKVARPPALTPRCMSVSDMQAQVNKPGMKIRYSFSGAETGAQRLIASNEAGHWFFISLLPADGGGVAACVLAEGAEITQVPSTQASLAFTGKNISCPQMLKALQIRPTEMNGSVGTLVSWKNAALKSKGRLPTLARENGWSAAKLKQQTALMDQYIDALGVPGDEFCAGKQSQTVSMTSFARTALYSEGYDVLHLGGVTWVGMEALRGTSAFVLAITSQSKSTAIGRQALVFALKQSGAATVVGSGYKAGS